jgi:parvulin-like peptidyl-prolyl isomerase
MNRFGKNILLVISIYTLCCSVNAGAIFPDPAASINGQNISSREAMEFLKKQIPPEKLAKMSNYQLHTEFREQFSKQINDSILKGLLRQSKITPSPEMVKNELTELINTLPAHRREALQNSLKKKNQTIDQYISKLSQNKTEQLKVALAKWITQKFGKKLKTTDDEAENYYMMRQELFTLPERIELNQIVVLKKTKGRNPQKAKELIETVYAQLSQGVSFDVLAKKYSECPLSAPNRGFAGEFTKAALPPLVSRAAFSTPQGKFSNIIDLPQSYVIIKPGKIIPAKHVPFLKVKDFVKLQLNKAKIEQNLAKIIQEKRAKLNIEFYF